MRAVMLIGGPLHRQIMQVRGGDLIVQAHASPVGPLSVPPGEYVRTETDTYELSEVVVGGVVICTLGFHRDTIPIPLNIQMRPVSRGRN